MPSSGLSALADATAALNVVGRSARTGWRLLRLAIVSGACVLSASRTAALVHYYGAPLSVYAALSHELSQAADKPQIVCVGKEWYRYPSSFFMPSANQKIAFIRAGFGGLLLRPNSVRLRRLARASSRRTSTIAIRRSPQQYTFP